MVFSSTIFLFGFLPVVLACYFLLPKKYRNAFLLLASLIFYGWGEPSFVFVMILSIIMNYLSAVLIDKYKEKYTIKKLIMTICTIINIGLLFVFKYLNWVTGNLQHFFSDIVVTEIVLPIGISFFTFQALSYVIDVYRGKVDVEKNILNVALYIALFPQLIAGPIVRYETIAAEIHERSTNWDDLCEGIKRFIIGLSKKAIIANNVAVVADYAFGLSNGDLSVGMAWLGIICYTLQIYFDFSGYSDMAIGLGRIFGFHFLENFNYPYISSSITDFWRRWHISLSSWFRDYVYIPLGGSRVDTRGKHIRNLFVVWFLTGMWHGASWNFIVWGLWYLCFLLLEKFLVHPEERSISIKCLYRVFTMLIVILGWVLFRAIGCSIVKQVDTLFKYYFMERQNYSCLSM